MYQHHGDQPTKQHRYPWAVVETAIQLYNNQHLTYRAIADKLSEHGVEVSHKTVFEWVQKFADQVRRKPRRKLSNYDIEESYAKFNGEWKYLYRARDRSNETISVYARPNKNATSARSFFKKELQH